MKEIIQDLRQNKALAFNEFSKWALDKYLLDFTFSKNQIYENRFFEQIIESLFYEFLDSVGLIVVFECYDDGEFIFVIYSYCEEDDHLDIIMKSDDKSVFFENRKKAQNAAFFEVFSILECVHKSNNIHNSKNYPPKII